MSSKHRKREVVLQDAQEGSGSDGTQCRRGQCGPIPEGPVKLGVQFMKVPICHGLVQVADAELLTSTSIAELCVNGQKELLYTTVDRERAKQMILHYDRNFDPERGFHI